MDSVSSRRLSVFPLLGSLSVVWVASSILIPYGFPGMGLGWVGLALAALWVTVRSTRSIAQVLRDFEAEPTPAVGAKSGRLAAPKWVHVAWLSLLAVSLFAGTTDPAANLSACKNGRTSCERSRLTLVEMTEGTLAERARIVSNCKPGFDPCDHSRPTRSEASEKAVAEHQRRFSDCKDSIGPCGRATLTELEIAQVARGQRQRAVSNCKNGLPPCDYSELTRWVSHRLCRWTPSGSAVPA